MSELILVDTSVWIRYLRRGAQPELMGEVQSWLDQGRVATTNAVELELLPFARSDEEFDRLRLMLEALPHLQIDADTWRMATAHGFQVRRAGITVPTIDLLLAVAALQSNAELAHADRHYELMAPVLGLRTRSLL